MIEIAEVELTDAELAEIELTDEELKNISGAVGHPHHWGWGHGFGFGGPFGYGAPYGFGYGYPQVVVAQQQAQPVVVQEPAPQTPVFELVQIG